MNQRNKSGWNRPRGRGFSLVELLVVIGVIGLLISILLPAVGKVRTQSKVAKCRATLSALDTGMGTFRSDSTFGGQLPPSRPDSIGDPNAGISRQVARPERNSPSGETIIDPISAGAGSQDRVGLAGASLLVWALVGADLLGSPGSS